MPTVTIIRYGPCVRGGLPAGGYEGKGVQGRASAYIRETDYIMYAPETNYYRPNLDATCSALSASCPPVRAPVSLPVDVFPRPSTSVHVSFSLPLALLKYNDSLQTCCSVQSGRRGGGVSAPHAFYRSYIENQNIYWQESRLLRAAGGRRPVGGPTKTDFFFHRITYGRSLNAREERILYSLQYRTADCGA